MWRDFHVISGRTGQFAFFPESGRFYGLPEQTAQHLRAYLAGAAELPSEAELMVRAEQAKGPAILPPTEEPEVTSLCLYAAHDCNLACTYCYNQRGRSVAPFAMMSPETACAAIDRFFRRPGVSYAAAFYGGEPLLNLPLIRATVRHAERLRAEEGIEISFSVTTNGTVMNREILALLQRHFSSVTVSLDGIKPVNDLHRYYEKSERRSAHDKAVETIRLLKEKTSLRVTVKGTLTAQGLPHYRESLAYLQGLGADAAALDPAFGPEDADWALSGESFERYVDMLAAEAGGDLSGIAEDRSPWHEYTFQIVANLLTKRRLLRHCNAGRDLAVMADGLLYACHGLAGVPAFHMGRVDEPGSADFERVRQTFHSLDVRSVSECDVCWARYLCGGSCYANAWFKTGTVRRPDPKHCVTFKRVAEKVVAAFVETATDPVRTKALARKIKGMIDAVVPAAHG